MKGSKWCIKCLKAPLKALTGVCDLYVKGMNGCAGRVQHGAPGLGCPTISEYSRNGSARSSASDEDFRELIRANSVDKKSMNMGAVRRSQSVVVGRIDEEEACCEFKDDDVKVGSDLLYPRSKSYAVGIKRRIKMFV